MNEIAAFYNKYPYPSLHSYPDNLRKFNSGVAPYNYNGNILVVGCGTVEAVLVAIHNPKATITGIDLSQTSIAIAKSVKRHLKVSNVSLFVGNILENQFRKQEYDLVIASGVLHHIKEVSKALDNINSLLKPNGWLTGMVYSDDRPSYIRSICDMKITDVKDLKVILEEWKPTWYTAYDKSKEELADTWMNPYYVEYNELSLKETLKEFTIAQLVKMPGKLLFSARKIDSNIQFELGD